jgi:uncharacterized delta-60 repeat protein
MLRRTAAPLLAAAIVLGAGTALAAGSELDTSFGNAGIRQLPDTGDIAFGVATLPGGDTVAVGQSGSAGVVVRVDPAGTPDAAFGTGGKLVLDLAAGWDWLEDAVPAGGGFVLAGSDGDHALLARINETGSLDPAFGGGDGVATFPLGSLDVFRDVDVDGSGRLVAGGYLDGGGVIGRFLPDGTPDTAFGGGDGFVTTPYEVAAVEVLGDGSVIAAGTTNGFPADLAVGRFDATGAPAAFGTGGTAVVDAGGHDVGAGLAVLGDGSVVTGGTSMAPGGNELVLAKLSAAGAVDAAFGTGGVARTATGGDLFATDLARTGSGRLLLAGGDRAAGTALVAAFLPSGALDATFGTGGIARTDVSAENDGWEGATLANGTLTTAGWAGDTIALARYTVGSGSGGDTTPPVIAPHPDMTVAATGPSGAVVRYQPPAATDDTDPEPVVRCAPAPGSLFPMGGTRVMCQASDASGNVSSSSFTVRVIGAAGQLRALAELVRTLPNPPRVQLLHKLEELATALGKGQRKQACEKLDQFRKAAAHQLAPGGARSDVLVGARLLGELLSCG